MTERHRIKNALSIKIEMRIYEFWRSYSEKLTYIQYCFIVIVMIKILLVHNKERHFDFTIGCKSLIYFQSIIYLFGVRYTFVTHQNFIKYLPIMQRIAILKYKTKISGQIMKRKPVSHSKIKIVDQIRIKETLKQLAR